MIYIIIGRKPNGDEWVIAKTYEDPEEATKQCEHLNKMTTADKAVFRVDTVSTPEEIAVASANFKELQLGKGWKVGDPVELQNRKPFTARELFPSTLKGVMVSDCIECGAYVRIPKHRLHAEWHNKIADL